MRPLSLRLEGFTCYRQPTEVSFDGLDLFAITGPTGSGKSSIVDGITYALYGRVPRLGPEVRSLISLSAERLQSAFEFAVDGERYRVVRSTARKGSGHVQLFRCRDGDDWEGIEDRSRAVEERVRGLLGLDYEGFIRSVLLPQGQFHLFLSGEPKQRYQVLEELLRLDVYARIMQAANGRANEMEQKLDELQRRLVEDYADATPEALKECKARLAEVEQSREALEEEGSALAEGRAAAEALRAALAARRNATVELEEARSQLDRAEATLREGAGRIEQLDRRIESAQGEIESAGYDPEGHQRLKLALTPARELEKASARVEELERRHGSTREQEAEARRLVEQRRSEAEATTSAFHEAEAKLEDLRRRLAAARLRSGLSAGDACPVCGQKVTTLPADEHVALDEARLALDAAAKAREKATGVLQAAETRVARTETAREEAERNTKKASEDVDRWRAELLERLGADKPVAAAAIERDIREQDAAQKRAAELSRQMDGLHRQRDDIRRASQEAESKAAAARAEVSVHERTVAAQEKESSLRRQALDELARRHGWADVSTALGDGGDSQPALAGRQAEVARRMAETDREIGAARTDVARIKDGIAQAKRLREEERSLRKSAGTARQLASLLRADRFQAYVQREALKTLAEDASRHLQLISESRYELDLEEPPESRDSTFRRESQEFVVIDHWGEMDRRSVKTLSGGETFLASLSLALALAERLPELGAATRPTRLDSLFLDEGFGTLDEDSLEAVASALERLHFGGDGGPGGPSGRVVGVITHRPELAERMPARIRVVKSQEGSHVEQG